MNIVEFINIKQFKKLFRGGFLGLLLLCFTFVAKAKLPYSDTSIIELPESLGKNLTTKGKLLLLYQTKPDWPSISPSDYIPYSIFIDSFPRQLLPANAKYLCIELTLQNNSTTDSIYYFQVMGNRLSLFEKEDSGYRFIGKFGVYERSNDLAIPHDYIHVKFEVKHKEVKKFYLYSHSHLYLLKIPVIQILNQAERNQLIDALYLKEQNNANFVFFTIGILLTFSLVGIFYFFAFPKSAYYLAISVLSAYYILYALIQNHFIDFEPSFLSSISTRHIADCLNIFQPAIYTFLVFSLVTKEWYNRLKTIFFISLVFIPINLIIEFSDITNAALASFCQNIRIVQLLYQLMMLIIIFRDLRKYDAHYQKLHFLVLLLGLIFCIFLFYFISDIYEINLPFLRVGSKNYIFQTIQLSIIFILFLFLFLLVKQSKMMHVEKREQEKEIEILGLNNKLKEIEFKSQLSAITAMALRSQINPHFIFNCLTSIQLFIQENKSLLASEYLEKFALLIRKMLENSRQEFVTLEDEIITLKLYLELEQMRLKSKFQYQLIIDSELPTTSLELPPMLIQPFVENAIWHGIMPKDNIGLILIHFYSIMDKFIVIKIIDNGIGRKRSEEIKSKTKTMMNISLGQKITSERISLINKKYGIDATVTITDLYQKEGDNSGTQVLIKIPII